MCVSHTVAANRVISDCFVICLQRSRRSRSDGSVGIPSVTNRREVVGTRYPRSAHLGVASTLTDPPTTSWIQTRSRPYKLSQARNRSICSTHRFKVLMYYKTAKMLTKGLWSMPNWGSRALVRCWLYLCYNNAATLRRYSAALFILPSRIVSMYMSIKMKVIHILHSGIFWDCGCVMW